MDGFDRYTDSPDENWVIGYYPNDENLFLATAGSGHAYKVRLWLSGICAHSVPGGRSKNLMPFCLSLSHALSASQFLPVVGRLVADAIEGTLPPDVAQRFAVHRPRVIEGAVAVEPEVRCHPPEEIVEDQLCGPEDLLPEPAA